MGPYDPTQAKVSANGKERTWNLTPLQIQMRNLAATLRRP